MMANFGFDVLPPPPPPVARLGCWCYRLPFLSAVAGHPISAVGGASHFSEAAPGLTQTSEG